VDFLSESVQAFGRPGEPDPDNPPFDPSTRSPSFRRIQDRGSFLFDDVIVSALGDQFVGPFVGLAERMGMAPEGSRQALRDEFLAAKELFTSTIDPETGEERSGAAVIGRKGVTLTAQLAANLLPLAPGFMAGNLVAVERLGSREVLMAVPTMAFGVARPLAATG